MNKKIILFITIIIVYLFLNLGNFMDVTEKPQQADIIVSLGGDDYGCRVKKAVSLYKKGISTSKILLYTGPDETHSNFKEFRSKKQYFLNQNLKNKNILHVYRITNTMEELLFIKKYQSKIAATRTLTLPLQIHFIILIYGYDQFTQCSIITFNSRLRELCIFFKELKW